MLPLDHDRRRRLEAARKAVALAQLQLRSEGALALLLASDFESANELTSGYQVIVEQLAIDLGRATDRSPVQVLDDLIMFCASHLDGPPPS